MKASIEAKVAKLQAEIAIVEQAKSREGLSKQDTVKVKRLMERLRLVLAFQRDLTEAKPRLADAKRVQEQKLEVHEGRKALLKDNNRFELSWQGLSPAKRGDCTRTRRFDRGNQSLLGDNVGMLNGGAKPGKTR